MNKQQELEAHISHCCIIHGCKYGDERCPVVKRIFKQDYLCEECNYDGIEDLKMLENVVSGKQSTCPYCSHVL